MNTKTWRLKQEIGLRGEDFGRVFLEEEGYKIIERGYKNSPYDIIVKKDNELYAINIKYSEKNKVFSITLANVYNLIDYCRKRNYIPCFMFIPQNEKVVCMFKLDKLFKFKEFPFVEKKPKKKIKTKLLNGILTSEVKTHLINKKHKIGKIYLPKDWIGKTVKVEVA